MLTLDDLGIRTSSKEVHQELGGDGQWKCREESGAALSDWLCKELAPLMELGVITIPAQQDLVCVVD